MKNNTQEYDYECSACCAEAVVEDSITDFHDPSQADGHGQYSKEVLACTKCDWWDDFVNEPEYD